MRTVVGAQMRGCRWLGGGPLHEQVKTQGSEGVYIGAYGDRGLAVFNAVQGHPGHTRCLGRSFGADMQDLALYANALAQHAHLRSGCGAWTWGSGWHMFLILGTTANT